MLLPPTGKMLDCLPPLLFTSKTAWLLVSFRLQADTGSVLQVMPRRGLKFCHGFGAGQGPRSEYI